MRRKRLNKLHQTKDRLFERQSALPVQLQGGLVGGSTKYISRRLKTLNQFTKTALGPKVEVDIQKFGHRFPG
jgi:hypothetical protein